jgi:hypothetical protein
MLFEARLGMGANNGIKHEIDEKLGRGPAQKGFQVWNRYMPQFRRVDEEKTKLPLAAPRQYLVLQITEIALEALGIDTIPGFGIQKTLKPAKRFFVPFYE